MRCELTTISFNELVNKMKDEKLNAKILNLKEEKFYTYKQLNKNKIKSLLDLSLNQKLDGCSINIELYKKDNITKDWNGVVEL